MIKTLLRNMPHPTQIDPKIKKFIINLESIRETKKIDAWWPLGIKVQVQQQRSLIMNMKNIVHEITMMNKYTSSNTKTQQYIIPMLDDTSNKNNKNVLII
jgi:hypothetical protein